MKVLKVALYSIGAVLAAIVLWLTVGGAIAENMLDQAKGKWERQNGSLASFHQRHPRSEKNESAKRLELLAASIGVSIRPRNEEEVIAADHPLVVELKTATARLNDFLAAQLQKTSGGFDAVPPELSEFIRKHRTDLIAIENHLTSAAAPTWRFDGEYLSTMELPNLLAHMQLARILSAHAVLALEEGTNEEAWHALHAVSKLSESLQAQPVLITQLISVAIAKQQTLLARHMPAPVPAWQFTAPRRDRRRDLIDAVIAEQLFVDASARNATLLADSGTGTSRLAELAAQPFLIACAADLWDVHQQLVAELEAKSLCGIDAPSFGATHAAAIAEWNVFGRMLTPDFSSSIRRVRDLELANEMTRKILSAKMSRLASAGVWPQSIEGIETCSCEGKKWNYSVSADGTMTLALDKPWAPDSSTIVPVPFTYSAR